MKKLIISGSTKLYERALYWRGYFEGRGYEVIDWPTPITDDPDDEEVTPTPGFHIGRILSPKDDTYDDHLINTYKRYYRHLDQADVFLLMNEDKDGIEGYIGYGAMAELGHVMVGNIIHNRKTEVFLLKQPNKSQGCYNEIKFWLDQGWIQIYQRPTGKKATLLVSSGDDETSALPESTDTDSDSALVEAFATAAVSNVSAANGDATPASSTPAADVSPAAPTPAPARASQPTTRRFRLFGRSDSFDIRTEDKKCLRSLTPEQRDYLHLLCPEFPTWLLKYISAPEFQRLSGVSMVSMDYTSLYSLHGFSSVFSHSIGVALIIWQFTHDKTQTLAGLFHDIASPSFKHAIDYLHGDSEKQESIEAQTGQIIRDSRVISRQLKKDGIMPSEVDDYKLYPLADNDVPGLAADRLEYTFSNGLFLYDIWTSDDIERFYSDLCTLTNENGQDEFGFNTSELATEFTTRNLKLAAEYHSEKSRASYQFLADIIKSMITSGYLTEADLYTMTEREVIDWILSCGDHTISDAFRAYQRATSVWSASAAKKNLYGTSVRSKVRYIDPLVAGEKPTDTSRISERDKSVRKAIESYLEEKQPKFVGFDFDFTPYSE